MILFDYYILIHHGKDKQLLKQKILSMSRSQDRQDAASSSKTIKKSAFLQVRGGESVARAAT
jgi:hypothetical protein